MPQEADENLPDLSPRAAPRGPLAPPAADRTSLEYLTAQGYVEPPQAAGAGVAAYWHALRRRWLAAAALGILCAGGAGAAVWFTHVPQYSAVSMLRIAAVPERLLPGRSEAGAAFDIYKNTQTQYLKSRFVLIAALRRPEVARLSTVQEEIDPVRWLGERVGVSFPGNGEIMEVGLRGQRPEELAALVNGVVDAYMSEVVEVERNERRRRLSDLDAVYSEKETELRNKRNDLKTLAEQLGTGDSDVFSLKQQLVLQRFAALRSEHAAVQFKLMRAGGEVKVRQGALARAEEQEISETELDGFAQFDPQVRQLAMKTADLEALLGHLGEVARPEIAARQGSRYQQELKSVAEQMAARREQLREDYKRQRRGRLMDEIAQLQFEMSVLSEQEKQLGADVEAARQEAEKGGGSSIDIQMLNAEIALLENLLSRIAQERQSLLLELREDPRISVVQKATVPQSPDKDKKIQLLVLASLGGLFLPGLLIVWLDRRGQRVNTSAEVSESAGLEIIGAVPLLPARAARSLAPTSRRHQHWRAVFTESVDGIAARILRKSEMEPIRVILVSSAVGGEGKTTLATQLAMSLARTGHRTALVDFDLRRPMIDRLLQVPLSPGVSEVLRGQADVSDALRPAGDGNLAVVTAGRWDRRGMAALANGVAGGMFARLREEFDFVVVDGSPILPVADARFLSRHVDGVVLAVLRDVSRLPKILAACEILSAFNVRTLGAVVTGSAEEVYYRDRYHSYVGVPEAAPGLDPEAELDSESDADRGPNAE